MRTRPTDQLGHSTRPARQTVRLAPHAAARLVAATGMSARHAARNASLSGGGTAAASELAALRFLVALDAAISATLGVGDTLTAITHAVVPFLADACLIDLLDTAGRLRRVAPGDDAAWANGLHEAGAPPPATTGPATTPPAIGAVREERASDGGDGAGDRSGARRALRAATAHSIVRDPIDAALRRGRPVRVARVTPAWRAAVARHGAGDRSQHEARAHVAAREALHLPLTAHGRRVGVLTLLATSPTRTFDASAQSLAREVAARIAIALDHAQRLAAAERATRAREEFIAVASHELKGPLTSLLLTVQRVRQFAQRAVTAASSASSRASGATAAPAVADSLLVHAIGLAERQVRRLAALLDDLFDFARMREGRLELRPETFDLAALLREVIARLDEDLAAARVPVSLVVPDGPVEGVWDRARVDQVVTNLLGNALKYGRGRPVEVRLEASPERAAIYVSDQGIGIAQADCARIFDRFERTPDAARHRPGLGLGLYIARTIVLAHGGAIRVESAPGEGSTFSVELPRAGA